MWKTLGGRIPLIIDAGPTERGLESTIVAATDGRLRLLRRGPIEVEGAIEADGTGIEAPGQLASHYAPSKPLRLNAAEAEADEFLIGFDEVRRRRELKPVRQSRGSRSPTVRTASCRRQVQRSHVSPWLQCPIMDLARPSMTGFAVRLLRAVM